jgi:hypothetical protein
MSNSAALVFARWEVLWIANSKIVKKDCGKDLYEAKRIYALALKANKPGVTLRCKNVGFPPPDKYYRKPMVKTEVVNGRKTKVKVYVSVMNQLNVKGIFWDPYCCEMRKFVKRKGYKVGGIYMQDPHLACPMCGISHDNFYVKKYNPLAQRLAHRTHSKATITAKTPDEKRAAARARREARKQRALNGE